MIMKEQCMNNFLKKILKLSLITVLLFIFVTAIILYFTPRPLFLFGKMLPIEANLTKPRGYDLTIEKNIQVTKNIQYSTLYSNSTLDIYSPKEVLGNLPLILFIHGGGFFTGEKEMTKFFGPTVSSKEYAFISVNYELVPNVTIFDQVKQVNEALRFIVDNADKYSLDVSRINLSGSSAGGFLALQLVSAYYDKYYTKILDLKLVDNIKINSLLLYSAVYDLSEFQTFKGNNFSKYLLSKIGWGLTGTKNWQQDKKLGQILNLNNHISENFPPVFVTDGNTKTFTKQASEYVCNLKKINVPVQTLFFDLNEKVGHGYQLKMDSHSSEKAVKESVKFLKKWN